MNIGKARALFEQVASREYHGSTVGEYLEAVKIVLDMETHNSISKKMIISVGKWLVDVAEELVSMHRWIPVSERLPEKGGEYLVSVHHTIGAISVFHPEKDTYVDDVAIMKYYGKFPSTVRAWMPLPEAYKPNK
jgi:hypothetical protein